VDSEGVAHGVCPGGPGGFENAIEAAGSWGWYAHEAGVGIDRCWWFTFFVCPKLHLDLDTLAYRLRLSDSTDLGVFSSS